MSRPNNRFADPTTPLLKQRIARLYVQIPKALGGAEEPLHQMRVAARRLRVALPLVAQKPQGQRVRRARRLLRGLTRGGGTSRDLDVITTLFEERALQAPCPERKALLRDLRSARALARRRLAGDLLDIDIARLRRNLDVVLSRRGEPVFSAFGRLRDAVEAGRVKLAARLEAIGAEFQPQELHQVRIRFRRLRYVAEVVDTLRGRESEAPALFRQVQEAVGHLHDAWVLAGWLERKAERAWAAGRAEVARVAREDHDHFMQRARAHHQDFLSLDPLTLLGRGIAAISAPRSAA